MTEEVKTEEVEAEAQDVELNENEVEEAHDPKNAEDQSIADADKAENAGKKAKHRKGDKSNSEPMPKVKAEEKAPKVKAEDVNIDGDFSEHSISALGYVSIFLLLSISLFLSLYLYLSVSHSCGNTN